MAKSANKWFRRRSPPTIILSTSSRACSPTARRKRSPAALKKSAQDPARHSDDPYRTAMSMLDFYVNRAGDKLSVEQRAKLDQAKMALRQSFGR